MPADMLEIEEAEEEGVIFLNLTNPLEIISDEDGHCRQMVLQVMELGEPDASGRRAPIPVEARQRPSTSTPLSWLSDRELTLKASKAWNSPGRAALYTTRIPI